MRNSAAHLSVHELLSEIYRRCNVLGIFGAMRRGAERKENLLAFLELSEDYARSGRQGLFDFVRTLREQLAEGEAGSMQTVHASSGVRIMSIHKSKGLEFPVVILSDLARRFSNMDFLSSVLVHPQLGLGPVCVDTQRHIQYPTVARQALERTLRREAKAEELRDKHRVPDAYDYVRQNILSSFKRVFGERLPVTLLREHYRCHPLIIDFCNRKYYRNELLIMTEPKGDYPFTVLTTTASKTYSHNGRIYNQRQIDATCDWIERQHTEYAAMRFASDAKRESPAERIAERLIGGILAEEDRFSAIGVHRHYRLYDLVGRNVELSDEERLFVRRRSHLDFLLYNRMDNTPILGIEVDGVLHHRFDEVQVARDRRKNGILVKIGLPLLRLSTDGSSEKERIVGALEQAMQQG